jgi:hypothetical protein
MPKRLGFFTRLLDQGSAQTRYRLAAEQIRHAERLGFDSAWIAQHHFHEQEGGLPSPLVFLAHVAAQTDRIRLGTAIITCRWKIRCASPKTRRCWIYSPTGVWRWGLAPAARQPRFCPSA